MSSKKKRKKIVWDVEPEKSDFKHPSLSPKEREELLIHKAFKK